jgi:hypothetical protein
MLLKLYEIFRTVNDRSIVIFKLFYKFRNNNTYMS